MKLHMNMITSLFIVFILSTLTIAGTITSIDPNVAQSGQNMGVGIIGQDTYFDQVTTMYIWFSHPVSLENIYAYGYFPVDDTYMTAWFDIPADAESGIYDLHVSDDIDGEMLLSNSFTIDPASFTVNPKTAQAGQKLKVLITGQDTHFTSGSTVVNFYNQGSPTMNQGSPTTQGSTTTSWFINDSLIMVEIAVPEDEPAGLRDMSVHNSVDGTMMLYDAITIEPKVPQITSVTPGGAYQGQKLSVSLSGQNTAFISGSFTAGSPTTSFISGSSTNSTLVWFTKGSQSIYSKDCIVHNPQYLTATLDIPNDAASGLWDVHVPDMEEGTVLTYPDGFNILQPGDWTGDGAVNMLDLGIVASHWLEGAL